MLYIILLILKIIGVILLVLLGLLLLILLTVLLVPIRYRATASHGEVLRIEGRVSWLFHFIHAGFSHIEGVMHIRIRVFGFILYDNLKPKSPKIKKDKKTVKRKVERTAKTKAGLIAKTKVEKTKVAKTNKKSERIIKDLKSDTIMIVEDHIQPNNFAGSLKDAIKPKVDVTLPNNKVVKEQEHQDSKEEKKSFLEKILLRLRGLKEKITAFFQGFKNKIIRGFESVVNIRQKASLILTFIKDEFNREGFHITYRSLKKLLKHILPTKLRSWVVFGTGDPCSTGQALGIMSILYSFYGDKIQITPDFENKRFEGKHDVKGRIRLVTILIIVIKLMLDKRFKQLKRNFLILKEAL